MYQFLAAAADAPATETDPGFWETLQQIGTDFAQNTGLAIVRTIAFLVLGLVIIKIVQAITRNATLRSSRLDNAAASFIISVVTVILYVALVIVLVSSLGFSTAGIIAGFSAVALAIALALKDSLGSLANGVIIIFTKPFKKGDYVQINEYDGLVQDIRLFNTKILTYSNEEIIIPNSDILTTDVVNYSTMPLRRIVFSLPVPYTADISEVKKVVLESIGSYKYVVQTPAPSVVLEDFGESTFKFSVRAWAPNENYWDTFYDLREIVYNALRERGMETPYNRLEISLASPDSTDAVPAAVQHAAASGKNKNEEDANQ